MAHRTDASSAPAGEGWRLFAAQPARSRLEPYELPETSNPSTLSPWLTWCLSVETAASRERVLSTAFPSGGPAIDSGRDAEPEHAEGHRPTGDTGHAVPPREF